MEFHIDYQKEPFAATPTLKNKLRRPDHISLRHLSIYLTVQYIFVVRHRLIVYSVLREPLTAVLQLVRQANI